MAELHFYTALLAEKQQLAPQEASVLDEEISILLHKLKFIPLEQRPSVLLVRQDTGFQPVYNEKFSDMVQIAGGKLLAEKFDNPDILLIIQNNESLYGEMGILMEDDLLNRTNALRSNQIFIVQKSDLGDHNDDFLRDVEICAEIIQPKYFIYGRQGQDWVKFDIV
ncbi:ABC transporter substrate-binding protein [Sphingobacterium griseoflavum]|uniref:ABC transporter substrate-binding protein n=1 Tax=Sphingobacterium griseoflavum TaxID=1474952 RepID=A0ABQ3HZI5_9SPHI|nr:ABC transporter substrate-binding protein [Sphingobacterium griseoflavum]GHE47602.1 hypothetical protein GCM10017764_33420 [Sphingobacterium griseoflavum]